MRWYQGQWAGSGVGKYIAESPKQSSKRLNSITKTILFTQLVILFIYVSMLHIYSRTITSGVCIILSCYRQNDAKVWNQKWCPTLYFLSSCTFIIMFPFKYLSICLISKFLIFSMLQIKFLILKMYITLHPPYPPNPQKRKGKMYVRYSTTNMNTKSELGTRQFCRDNVTM